MTDYETYALTFIDKIACMSDAELSSAYLECDGQCGDAWEDAPAETCRERNIDL